MTNNATSKGGTLIGVEVVATELATGDPADRMDEVGPVKVLKPILIRVVGVGTTIEIIGRRVLPTFFVTCVLGSIQYECDGGLKREYLHGNLLR